jgi:antitoxin FitA
MNSAEEITTNLTVRALPARVRATLAARAKARRQSLNAYLLDVLSREANTPTMDEVLADIDSARASIGLTTDDAVAAVRAVRDAEEARWG